MVQSSSERLTLLIAAAKERIKETVQLVGLNQTYAAFSGGKDSQAVLRLCRELYPTMLAIHNCHEGESIDPTVECVLSIRKPKAEQVPKFISSVHLLAQIDGTRQDEDKTVIFDGVEIHRSKMPKAWTANGVFGLHCCYPLFDWTEEDVFEYLALTDSPKVDNIRFSYEGEGPLLGTKTLFCRYPAQDKVTAVKLDELKEVTGKVRAIYVTASKLSPDLGAWAASLSKEITIEVPAAEWFYLEGASNVRYFIVVDHLPYAVYPSAFPRHNRIFIKIRVMSFDDFESKLDLANTFASAGHQVLLMPEYGANSYQAMIGPQMIKAFDNVHPGVRIMPPVQQLIGIE